MPKKAGPPSVRTRSINKTQRPKTAEKEPTPKPNNRTANQTQNPLTVQISGGLLAGIAHK